MAELETSEIISNFRLDVFALTRGLSVVDVSSSTVNPWCCFHVISQPQQKAAREDDCPESQSSIEGRKRFGYLDIANAQLFHALGIDPRKEDEDENEDGEMREEEKSEGGRGEEGWTQRRSVTARLLALSH